MITAESPAPSPGVGAQKAFTGPLCRHARVWGSWGPLPSPLALGGQGHCARLGMSRGVAWSCIHPSLPGIPLSCSSPLTPEDLGCPLSSAESKVQGFLGDSWPFLVPPPHNRCTIECQVTTHKIPAQPLESEVPWDVVKLSSGARCLGSLSLFCPQLTYAEKDQGPHGCLASPSPGLNEVILSTGLVLLPLQPHGQHHLI